MPFSVIEMLDGHWLMYKYVYIKTKHPLVMKSIFEFLILHISFFFQETLN